MSTVTNSSSARKHGCNMGTDRIAGDPAKVPKVNSLFKLILSPFLKYENIKKIFLTYTRHLSASFVAPVSIRINDFASGCR